MQTKLLILNLEEIRRKSIMIWEGLPQDKYHWKPDEKAMTGIEMIRHVLEADYGWNIIINQGDMSNYETPWRNMPFMSLEEELAYAAPYRKEFIKRINEFTEEELSNTQIIHPGNGERKNLGQYILRIGYHEAVHAGQFLSYLRMMQISIPQIWN